MNTFEHDLILNLINLTVPILIPWILSYIRELTSKIHLEKAQMITQILVKAAMQTMDRPERIATAKTMILTTLKTKFPKVDVDILDCLVESCVLETKNNLKI